MDLIVMAVLPICELPMTRYDQIRKAADMQQECHEQNLNQPWPRSASLDYMIQGKYMTLREFVDTLYPEDCTEKTMLILRLNKGNDL